LLQYEGCSIAVNGVCLTVTKWDANSAVFGVAPETLKRTNLDVVVAGDYINLEHSLKSSDLNSGHYVQGHVDGTGTLANTWREGDALWVRISCEAELVAGIVTKGYVSIDGTSLTVCEVGKDEASNSRTDHPGDVGGQASETCWFSFMLVRHTQAHISLPKKPIGSPINIEVDVMGKYADRAMTSRLTGLVKRVESLERSLFIASTVALVGVVAVVGVILGAANSRRRR